MQSKKWRNDINQHNEVEEELSNFLHLCVLSNQSRIVGDFNLKQLEIQFRKKT